MKVEKKAATSRTSKIKIEDDGSYMEVEEVAAFSCSWKLFKNVIIFGTWNHD